MSELTHVELLWIKKQVENRIRFGRSVDQHIIDRQWRVVSFEAGSIFAFVRWGGNDYGTTLSRIDILRAVALGERYITVPYGAPAAKVCCRFPTGPRSRRCCRLSMRSRRSASIRPMPPQSTGSISTIVSLSASGRDPTLRPGIKPGCTGGS